MQCSRGHSLNGDEKFCSECGEPTRRCPNGHPLTRSAKFCSECGVNTESTTLPTSPHLSATESLGDSLQMVPEIPSEVVPNTQPAGPVASSRSTLEPGEVMVMCIKCGYEESASIAEEGWQCGRCDANWYVMSCGHCGEPQVVPEETGRTMCMDCQTPLAKFDKYSKQLSIGEVEPHARRFLTAKYHSGVLKRPSTSWTTSSLGLQSNGIPHQGQAVDPTVNRAHEKHVDQIVRLQSVPLEGSEATSPNIPYQDTLFKRPLAGDWCVWLGAIAVASGLAYVSKDKNANAIDYGFAAIFQWSLFAGLPATIRRKWEGVRFKTYFEKGRVDAKFRKR